MRIRNVTEKYIGPTLTLLGIFVVWELSVWIFQIPVWLLPAPSRIYTELGEWWSVLPKHIWVTFYETGLGFLAAIVLGVLLAVVIISSPFLRNTIYPLLVVTQSVPKVAIAPILLVWLGVNVWPIITVAFLVAFFPMVVNMATGLSLIPPEMLELSRILRASWWQVLIKVRFPMALPHFFAGVKIAIAFSVIGAVIGEFVGSDAGLGFLILTSSARMNTSLGFGAIVILSALGVGLFAITAGVERLLSPWYLEEEAGPQP
ncbi:MAG: ABC transporter permease [Nitrospinota bacterium]